MPLREFACKCQEYNNRSEVFCKTDTPIPVCEYCGAPMQQMISTFAVAFSGAITSRYNNKGENQHIEGHWAWERKTPDGRLLEQPRQRFISTWQERKEYMKQEGLRDDVGNIDASSDGRTVSHAGAGMPGAWV